MSPEWTNVRSLFISDVHLGYRGRRAAELLEFLGTVHARNIFLIGDLIDCWALRRSLYWPKQHQDVLKALFDRARRGTRVVYVPGNYDDLLRDFCGLRVSGIEIRRKLVHKTADGRRMLILHGDEFDGEVRFSRFRRALGSGFYSLMLNANQVLERIRRPFGFGYWSLTDWLKRRVADARRYIASFEQAAAQAAERAGCDGVLYCNDGDWVESCTALVEDFGGSLSLLRWSELAHAATEDATQLPLVAFSPASARIAASRRTAHATLTTWRRFS